MAGIAAAAGLSGLLFLTNQRRRGNQKLAERVRSRISRSVSHPSMIEVSANKGVVTLSGAVPEDEENRLIHGVSGIRGVDRVENRLSVHRRPEIIPELQGTDGRKRPFGVLRVIMVLMGGVLTLYGMRKRHPLGRAAGFVGTGLLAKGVATRSGSLKKIIQMATR
jgi:hypothetical protein